jgi:homocysteine S-methyltransferase
MLEQVRPLVQGVQVSAPFGHYDMAAEVIAGALPQGMKQTHG